MECNRPLSVASLALICFGLSACKSEVEFSQAPFSSEDKSEIRPVKTSVFASLPIDMNEFQADLERAFPEKIFTTRTWLRRAACYQRRGRKICKSALSHTKINRAGNIKLEPYKGGVAAILPLKGVFSASGQGRASDIGDAVEEQLNMRIAFDVTLNNTWQAKVMAKEVTIKEGAAPVKLLGQEIRYQNPLVKKIKRLTRNLPTRLQKVLEQQSFQSLAQKSWRRLHDPIQISAEPQIWLRAQPISVSFGGFADEDGHFTTRLAIKALMSTSVHDRPVPLMPSPLPALLSFTPGDQKSHMNFSLPISYDEIAPTVDDAMLTDGITIGNDTDKILVHSSKADIYPSGHFLALQLHVKADVKDEWFARKGKLYLTASPWFNAEKASLTLNNVVFTQPKSNPKFFRDGVFLFQKSPLIERFQKSINLNLNQRFEKLLTRVNGLVNRRVGENIWLTGSFKEIGVSSISPRTKYLQLNLNLRGVLNLSSSKPANVRTLPTQISAASVE